MMLVQALGFVFFGVLATVTLTYWYVVRWVRNKISDPHLVAAIIRGAVAQVDKSEQAFYVLFPAQACPMCGGHVAKDGAPSVEPILVLIQAFICRFQRDSEKYKSVFESLSPDDLELVARIYEWVEARRAIETAKDTPAAAAVANEASAE